MVKGKKEIIIMKGCGTCDTAKKAGMCKDNRCRDVSTKLGKKLALRGKIEFTPQCIIRYPDGRVVKCNTLSILKKYLKKKK